MEQEKLPQNIIDILDTYFQDLRFSVGHFWKSNDEYFIVCTSSEGIYCMRVGQNYGLEVSNIIYVTTAYSATT